LFGGALNLGKQLTSDISKVGKTILNGTTNVAAIAKTLPPSLLSAAPVAPLVTSVLSGANALSGSPQRVQDQGGWLGQALKFGNTLVNQAKSAGQSALQLGRNAWNGASKWVSDHKAEIAIGVGVVALAAATIATGGAALAVVGAVGAGGLGALATGSTLAALGAVAAGGFVGGMGFSAMSQGAQMKDGKRRDFSFGEMVQSGATGAALAPAGAVLAGALPVVAGGIAGYGVYQGVSSGVQNWQQGNKWSAALDFGTAGLSALPFASRKGLNSMFGSGARARTAQTLGRGPKPSPQPKPQDVGLSNRGYRPKPGERSTTNETQSSRPLETKVSESSSKYRSTPGIRKEFREFFGKERYAEYAREIENLKLKHPELKTILTEDLVAVRGYTSSDYSMLNTALRNGDPVELARLNAYIRTAESGLSQLPSYKGSVFRGTAQISGGRQL
jgi:hypothetical protein